MATQMTKNGVTTTNGLGQEQYEKFKTLDGKIYVQYDYRHTNGVLFSTIKSSVKIARSSRDNWLRDKGLN